MEMDFMTYGEYGQALELTQQFIAEELKNIGIKMNISVIEGSVMWAASTDGGTEQNGNFDIDIYDDGYAGIDPSDFLYGYYHSASATPDYGTNYGRWKNAEFDSLLEATYTLDESVRKENFCKMAQILEDELPQALLFTGNNADSHSARLQNVQSSTNDLVTWNVKDWTLAK